MSDIFATIMAQHAARRAAAGVTGAARRAGIKSAAVAPTGERAAALIQERSDRRAAIDWERDALLKGRAASVRVALASTDDDTRAARLEELGARIAEVRAALTGGFWNDTHVGHNDLKTGGMFHRYAAYHYGRAGQNLGMLGFDAADIVSEAAELCYQWLIEDGADMAEIEARAAGEWIAGGIDTGIPLGLMYRAIKTVYRRGLGEFGNTKRGKLTVRDEVGHVHAVESDTEVWAREEQALIAEAQRIARKHVRMERRGLGNWSEDVDPETLELIERRARSLDTLAGRFPVNADGRMIAAATMLAEGYTVEEIAGRAEVTPRTIERWSTEELASLTAPAFAYTIGSRDAALDARLAAWQARQPDTATVTVTRRAS